VLQLAIEDAPGYADLAEEAEDSPHNGLPGRAEDDDWNGCADLLFPARCPGSRGFPGTGLDWLNPAATW